MIISKGKYTCGTLLNHTEVGFMNIEKYTQNAQSAIIDCQNIAIEEGHQQIDGEASSSGAPYAEATD